MRYNIAVVGKPNVGKTTFINKFVSRNTGLVYDQEGITRDRNYVNFTDNKNFSYTFIDTPGVDFEIKTPMQDNMHKQTEYAIQEANLCLFIIDGRNGIDNREKVIQKMLFKNGKKVILIINKVDSENTLIDYSDFYTLGFDKILFISSEHKRGFDELRKEIQAECKILFDSLGIKQEQDEQNKKLRISIVGRPNAGKSTFINKILQHERCVVSEVAGTTRDAINIDCRFFDQDITLIDTAGIRKKMNIVEEVEKKMIFSSLQAIKMSDIAILIADAQEGFLSQDFQIIDVILKEGRIPIICFNKIDLIENPEKLLQQYNNILNQRLYDINTPVMFGMSAKNDDNLQDIAKECIEMYERFCTIHKTSYLNKILENFVAANNLPYIKNSQLKLKYIAQIKAKPPYFMISSNFEEKDIKQSFISMLKKHLIHGLKLQGIPIRIKISKTQNPYAKKNR